MKISHVQLAIGSICLIMAFVITLQVRSVKFNRVSNPSTARAEDLQKQLNAEQENNSKLMEQVLQYRDELDQFKTKALTNSDYSNVLSKQLERSELLAGLTQVEGTGIIVSLRDSRIPSDSNSDPNWYVVHDTDILMILNELRDAGAEAIQLNGERIVSTTEIRCAGSVVSVNNNRCAEPFEITAIGDSANMENALLMRQGVYDTLRGYGIEITIKKSNKVTINAYNGNITFKYANRVATPQKEAQQ